MNTIPLYNVEYELLDPIPSIVVEDEPILFRLRLRNTGLTPWLNSGCPVMIVLRWMNIDGNVVIEFPWRPIPSPVSSGHSVEVELRIDQTPTPGDYILVIELVEYNIAWFRDRGVQPFYHSIRVDYPRGPCVTVINGNCLVNDAVGSHVIAQVQALAESGFQPLLLTEFVDNRIPCSIRRFMAVVNLQDILNPNNENKRYTEHFRRSVAIIVNYSTYYNLVNLIREARAPVLFDYHGITPPEIWGVGQPGYDVLVRGLACLNLVQFADFAVAHSQYMVNEIVATGLIASSRVSVLPYPVISDVTDVELPATHIQQRYGLKDKRVLLYVGRMARNKSIHVIVQALPIIQSKYPNTVLLLVGETGHPYASYVAEVKLLAEELGIADCLIFTGAQDRNNIGMFYRLCDAFVTASVHEGFCMPIIEAMLYGKPVIAAAATALPDTVGDAGLLFTPNDPNDLARKVIRIFTAQDESKNMTSLTGEQAWQMLRQHPIAFVTPRYGDEVLGGAERGARAWAEQLAARGLKIEVLTTNVVDFLAGWRGDPLPETENINGVTVRRFTVDLIDSIGFHEVQLKAAHGESITRLDEERFMSHNLRSRAMEEYIASHREKYAAFIFTPYLYGTTYYGAQKAGDRAFHIPCLHDEPAAQFTIFREMLEEARGIFFNSPAEERLARDKLRLINSQTTILGYGFPNQPPIGSQVRFRERTNINNPFLLYSGRLETAKNVQLLINWFVDYKQLHSESELMLVLAGKGDVPIPDRPDIICLGMITDQQELADVYESCLALCQLSTNESFSIVVMEAWQHHRPVIVHADCAVTREHVERSNGGYVCHDSVSFCAAVDSLVSDPDKAKLMGDCGFNYVQTNYIWDILIEKFVEALATFSRQPMISTLKQRGIRRALDFTYDRFAARFIEIVHKMCERTDWRLFEEISHQVSLLKEELASSLNGPSSIQSNQAMKGYLRRFFDNHQPFVKKQQREDTMLKLMINLFELLIFERNTCRYLERKLAHLQDKERSSRDAHSKTCLWTEHVHNK